MKEPVALDPGRASEQEVFTTCQSQRLHGARSLTDTEVQSARKFTCWQTFEGHSVASPLEDFHQLLLKLGQTRDAELRQVKERLESEKVDLVRQNTQLRREVSDLRTSLAKEAGGVGKNLMARAQFRSRTSAADARPSPVMTLPTEAPPLPGSVGAEFSTGEAAQEEHDILHREKTNATEEGEELADSGGEHFPMLPAYRESNTPFNNIGVTSEMTGTHLKREVSMQSSILLDDKYDGFMKPFIGAPRSPMRLAWEVIGCALIMYDLFVVPIAVFCYPETRFTIGMDWFTLIFWTANMLNTCTMGYETDSKLVMDPARILMHYLRFWFWMDLLVVLPDFIFMILSFDSRKPGTNSCSNIGAGGGFVRLMRSLRLVRMVRLTRVARLRRLWQRVQQMIYSVTASIAANILVMVVLLLIISHFISCCWFAISENWQGEDRWITIHHMEDASWAYQYTTAMHWSITQFTPASMQIVPHNIAERVFTIAVVVFALVCFSYVVGSITGSLAQLRSIHEEMSKQFWDLRRFLRRNSVNPYLSQRITRYLEIAWQREQESQSHKQVKILQLLSEQLHDELLFELAVSHLTVHPLLKELQDVSRVTAFRLASNAVSRKLLARHDYLFIRGEKPTHMYIVMSGRLMYKRIDSSSQPHDEQVDQAQDWIAEPVLWSSGWTHLGNAMAVNESRLMLVEPKKFCEVVQRNPSAWLLVTTYCRKFLKWLNSVHPDHLSDISQGEDIGLRLQKFMEIDVEDELARSNQLNGNSSRVPNALSIA